MSWYEIKTWLVQTLELDKDALHIYAALLVQLIVAIFTRRSLASPLPWIAALVVVLLNEYIDYQNIGSSEKSIARYKAAAWHDMWNTMLLPTVLILLARYWPRLLSHKLAHGAYPASEKDRDPD